MNEHKYTLQQRTKNKYIILLICQGIKKILKIRRAVRLVAFAVIATIIIGICLMQHLKQIIGFPGLIELYMYMYICMCIFLSLWGLYVYAKPAGANRVHDSLQRAGITNGACETPLLLAVQAPDPGDNRTTYIFNLNGISEKK